MSGHSKWATIKRKKGVSDARRGAMFTKVAREIMVAAREGGDPESNFRLRMAVQKAREINMPNENIDRAIKRGMGGTDGANFEEVTYEGYGPQGSAIIVEALTDNRNRTVSEIRNIFNRAGGSLGESGSVGWMFEQMGVITVDPGDADPEELALQAIDAGAEDVKIEEDVLEAYTGFTDLKRVQDELQAAGLTITSADKAMVPKTSMTLDEKGTLQTIKLMDRLEGLDDVQRVYTNLDIPDEVLANYEGE